MYFATVGIGVLMTKAVMVCFSAACHTWIVNIRTKQDDRSRRLYQCCVMGLWWQGVLEWELRHVVSSVLLMVYFQASISASCSLSILECFLLPGQVQVRAESWRMLHTMILSAATQVGVLLGPTGCLFNKLFVVMCGQFLFPVCSKNLVIPVQPISRNQFCQPVLPGKWKNCLCVCLKKRRKERQNEWQQKQNANSVFKDNSSRLAKQVFYFHSGVAACSCY